MPFVKHRHVDDPQAVGRRLLELREQRGLTQRALAFDGCSAAYISRCEQGKRVPSLQLMVALAVRLGTTAEYLARGTGHTDAVRMLLDGLEVDSIGELELLVRLGRAHDGRSLSDSGCRPESCSNRDAIEGGTS